MNMNHLLSFHTYYNSYYYYYHEVFYIQLKDGHALNDLKFALVGQI